MTTRAQAIIRRAHERRQRALSEHDSKRVIAAYGVPTTREVLVKTPAEAGSAARRLGYPVVLKVCSAGESHKTEKGLVAVGLAGERDLRAAFGRLKERAGAGYAGDFLVQEMIEGSRELMIGMVRDPQFGPLMMFGSGGVEVEGLKDVAFALAPLNQAEAEKMIRKTWAGRKLKGFRDIPPADEESVIDVLIKLSWLAMENENIREIEINPLSVLSKGVIAVDVRIKTVA